MFLGEYVSKFTGKGRIILPKKLRVEVLGDEIILSKGFERCVWGFTREGFGIEAKRQLEMSATEEKARNLKRYIFSSSEAVELDSQNRFVISENLLNYARLKVEVVIIGAGDHFEIWDMKAWKKQLKKIEEEYARVS